MRSPARRRSAFAIATIVVGSVVVTGCSTDTMGLPESATTQGDEVTSLWKIFIVLAIAVTLLIWALTTYVVISGVRRRRHAEAAARAAGSDAVAPPAQTQYRTGLEIAYTVAPLVLVVVLLVMTFNANAVLLDTSKPEPLNVNVIGFQWQWQFEYPDQGITIAGDPETPPTLKLPVGRNVLFSLYATDVIHSFWVPEFLEKRDLIPGGAGGPAGSASGPTQIPVFVKSAGTWTGRCAEYCGFNHWLMTFKVEAVPAAEFDAWVQETKALPQPRVSGGTVVPGTVPATATMGTAPRSSGGGGPGSER